MANPMTIIITHTLLISIFIIPIRIATGDGAGGLSADECLERGFKRSELQCTRCNELESFGLLKLRESCLTCCSGSVDDTDQVKKYPAARLEMCRCKLGRYPMVNEFLKNYIDRFPKVTFKHIPGLDPVIKLLNSRGGVAEEMSIERWDTDTIQEFLREHIES